MANIVCVVRGEAVIPIRLTPKELSSAIEAHRHLHWYHAPRLIASFPRFFHFREISEEAEHQFWEVKGLTDTEPLLYGVTIYQFIGVFCCTKFIPEWKIENQNVN